MDNTSAIVQLKGDPISTNPSTKPPHGRKIDFNGQAVRSYRAQLNQKRNEFKHWLRSNAPSARVTGEYDVSLNAVAVQLNGTPLARIAAAPMVQSAEYNALYHPTLSQSHKIIIRAGCSGLQQAAERLPAPASRSGISTPVSMRRILSSIRPVSVSRGISQVRCSGQQFAPSRSRLQIRHAKSHCGESLLQ